MSRLLPSAIVLSLATFASAGEPRLTHGPILGRLSKDGVGVWVRTETPGKFRVSFGFKPDRLDLESDLGETRLEQDNTGWLLLHGLKPSTRYYYHVSGSPRPVDGSFRTLPDADSLVDAKLNPRGLFNFRFEFACGNNQTSKRGLGPALPTFKTMLERHADQLNFAILNGDWLYEDKRDHTLAAWQKQVGLKGKLPTRLEHAPTTVGVWENYKVYLERGANLSAWHRNVPSFFTFDDHEILNDVWGAGQAGIRERRALFRDVGVGAWYDYLGWSNPQPFTQGIHFGDAALKKGSDILTDSAADFTRLNLKEMTTLHVHWGKPTAGVDDNALDEEPPGNPNAGVFEVVEVINKSQLRVRPAAYADGSAKYSIGRRNYFRMPMSNCDFFFLDTRSHRDMHDLENPGKKGISMLGKEQKAWLLAEMKKSRADFFFVLSSVNMMVPHVGGGEVRAKNKDDAWTVFLEEREELIRFWDGLGKPVFVLTGDLHNSFVVRVTENVWEFASGPHNSNNHRLADEGDRPANGPYDSRGRKCDIRWSSAYANDIPREELLHPLYCVVQVNNVYNNPLKVGEERWIAFPRPQVVFQYYDGRTGELRYAEAIGGRTP